MVVAKKIYEYIETMFCVLFIRVVATKIESDNSQDPT